MLNDFNAHVSAAAIKSRMRIYNSMWLNMHAVRAGDDIAILGSNTETEEQETWLARMEKFVKVEEAGERTWDVVMVRYFEDLEERHWPEDISQRFWLKSNCRILRWDGMGKKVFFVAAEHVICRVDMSPIQERALFIYNPWTTTVFSKIAVIGHPLVENSL